MSRGDPPAGVRRSALARHGGGAGPTRPVASESTPAPIDGVDVDPDELREFLEADTLGAQADPIFKDRLRQQLWRIVRAGRSDRAPTAPPKDEDPS